jgi:preprotein translocase subunit YajC
MSYHDLFFLAQAAAAASPQAQSQQQPPPGSFLLQMIPFICIGVIFYFLVIRPQSQKHRQQAALISALKTGDKVVTSGGIHGLIANVKDSTVILKVADNVKIEVDKASVTTVVNRANAPASAS